MLDTVLIGGLTYEVEYVENLIGDDDIAWDGCVSYEKLTIEIDATLSEPIKAVTVLHEVIHVLWQHGGIHKHNEQLIECLSHGLYQVLRDNPVLLALILQTG